MADLDWHDMLAGLRSSMAEDTSEEALPEATTPAQEAPAQSQRLDIVYERKGRAGKPATIVCGFSISDNQLQALATEIKKKIGTGGSVRDGELLLQGDRRQDALKFLTAKGFKARII